MKNTHFLNIPKNNVIYEQNHICRMVCPKELNPFLKDVMDVMYILDAIPSILKVG